MAIDVNAQLIQATTPIRIYYSSHIQALTTHHLQTYFITLIIFGLVANQNLVCS